MSQAATPWMKFFPQDWRADERLRMCSLEARGLWIELLAIMHRSERYGQLLIGGRVPTDAQLAVQVGAPPDQVTKLIGELETAGVFSRAVGGVIYSRRMTRDHKKAKTARKNGKNGGNPNLCKNKEIPASDKGEVKPPDKGGLKPQRPEARGQSKPQTPFDRQLREVMEAGGMITIPSDAVLLRQWITSGADFEDDILPACRAIGGEIRARGGQAPFKLKLFDSRVREAIARKERDREHYREVAARYSTGAA